MHMATQPPVTLPKPIGFNLKVYLHREYYFWYRICVELIVFSNRKWGMRELRKGQIPATEKSGGTSLPSFKVTIVTWLLWKRKGYFRLSQFHDSYLRKELGLPTSGKKYFVEQIVDVLYSGRHTSTVDTYTLALTGRLVLLWSTPSSPPTETRSWWPTSCCRQGRGHSGSARGQCPDSEHKKSLNVKSFF